MLINLRHRQQGKNTHVKNLDSRCTVSISDSIHVLRRTRRRLCATVLEYSPSSDYMFVLRRFGTLENNFGFRCLEFNSRQQSDGLLPDKEVLACVCERRQSIAYSLLDMPFCSHRSVMLRSKIARRPLVCAPKMTRALWNGKKFYDVDYPDCSVLTCGIVLY